MDFNRFFTNEEIETLLKEWEVTFPGLMSVSKIGASHEKQPIWLITVTNRQTVSDSNKPAIWIDGNIHATELTGSTTALYIAYQLLEGYSKDERVKRLLDRVVFYIVPRINPDGAALAMASSPRYIRSGVRHYPWEEKDEGLHVQDINGDGRILQMRIRDANGDWKISTLDPRLMEKRSPDELGDQYFRLLPEGLLDEYDGYQIRMARPPEGLDFNRNFPFEWHTESDQSGAGPYPASEPEIRTVVDFVTKHPNINIAITFHTFSRVILRPYSTKPDDDMDSDDLEVYKIIGEIGTELTGYRCVSTFHDFKYHSKKVTTGAFDDWMYDHFGVFTFTVELWDLPTEAGIENRKFIEWWQKHPHEEDAKILKWIDEHGEPDSYVEWKPYQHPQLGQVELGGWNNINTWRNPPHAYIEAEASKHMPFMLSLGDLLPWLSVIECKAERLGDDKYHLLLVVENNGFLPTYTSNQGKTRAASRPLRVELNLPENAQLTSGKRRSELGHLEGRSNKLSLDANMADSPTDNRAKGEWVIHAPSGTNIEIKVMSDRAGNLIRQITLE